jgi:hypothetical protein
MQTETEARRVLVGAAEIELLSQNLAAIVPNYRRIGVTVVPCVP